MGVQQRSVPPTSNTMSSVAANRRTGAEYGPLQSFAPVDEMTYSQFSAQDRVGRDKCNTHREAHRIEFSKNVHVNLSFQRGLLPSEK